MNNKLLKTRISSRYVEKDKLHRVSFGIMELHRLTLKSIYSDQHLPKIIRFGAHLELNTLSGNKSVIRNRCILTGRARAIFRSFRVSRILYRQLADEGFLPGVRKASW